MIYCLEMTRSSLVQKDTAADGPCFRLLGSISTQGRLSFFEKVISSGDINTRFNHLHNKTGPCWHSPANATTKGLCTLKVPGYHLQDKREKNLEFSYDKNQTFYSFLFGLSLSWTVWWVNIKSYWNSVHYHSLCLRLLRWNERKEEKNLLNDSFYRFQIQ